MNYVDAYLRLGRGSSHGQFSVSGRFSSFVFVLNVLEVLEVLPSSSSLMHFVLVFFIDSSEIKCHPCYSLCRSTCTSCIFRV